MRSSPVEVISDVLRLGQEIRQDTIVKLDLSVYSSLQEFFSSGVESSVEMSKEGYSFLSQDCSGWSIQLSLSA